MNINHVSRSLPCSSVAGRWSQLATSKFENKIHCEYSFVGRREIEKETTLSSTYSFFGGLHAMPCRGVCNMHVPPSTFLHFSIRVYARLAQRLNNIAVNSTISTKLTLQNLSQPFFLAFFFFKYVCERVRSDFCLFPCGNSIIYSHTART